MKDQLLEIIKTVDPRKVSQTVKQNKTLFEWVLSGSGQSIAEKIYNLTSTEIDTCKYGNQKKFKSLTDGYVNCGKASSCQCAKDSISKKVSVSKSKYTIEKQQAILEKRAQTNLSKYGVVNSGQTDKAKAARSEFYSDTSKVSKLSKQIKATKQSKYGDENYNNATQIKSTLKASANEYYASKFPDKLLTELKDKDTLLNWYQTYTIDEIANLCKVHKHTVYKYLAGHNIREPFKSSYEQEIINFLKQHNVTNIVTNSRKLIPSKKEIDIYLPDYNFAIEYNGIYWHHEDIPHITKLYHYNKFKECEDQNIQLFTIFSNVWEQKKNIIKNAILHKIHLSSAEKIFARKCQIKTVTNSEIRNFLDNNHVQGYVAAQNCYGLFYKDKLVAVMTFSKSKSRIGIGGGSANEYELVRYATSAQVVGGAGKLLNKFINEHTPSKIISYSANEWSTGALYKSLNFECEAEILPGYWYIKPKEHRLYHRFNFSKQQLVKLGYDDSLTEQEITKQLGLLKLWDCGKKKWVLSS